MGTGTQQFARCTRLACYLAVLFLCACAAAPPPAATVIRTVFQLPETHPGFNNVLVVSVAGDFESRALLERSVAAALDDLTGRATAYFTLVGRRPLLTSATLETVIVSRGFDAVLFTRQKGQERADLVPGRPTGSGFDLFAHEYPELNSADSIRRAAAITFVTELYSTADLSKVWSIESLSFDKESATDLIVEQASTIATQVRLDGLLAP